MVVGFREASVLYRGVKSRFWNGRPEFRPDTPIQKVSSPLCRYSSNKGTTVYSELIWIAVDFYPSVTLGEYCWRANFKVIDPSICNIPQLKRIKAGMIFAYELVYSFVGLGTRASMYFELNLSNIRSSGHKLRPLRSEWILKKWMPGRVLALCL